MPKKRTYGTGAFGGMNSSVAPHLLEDHELQDADNCRFDVVGAVRPALTDSLLYSGASRDLQGIAALDVHNETGDQVYYRTDGDTYYNGTKITTLAGELTHTDIITDGHNVYFLDGGANLVVDGDAVRGHGPCDEITLSASDNAQQYYEAITSVTASDPANIEVSGHGLSTGDVVYLANMTGAGTWDTLNDQYYTVAVVDVDNFTLDGVDGSGLGSFTSGDCYLKPLGISGQVRYAVQVVMSMGSGRTVTTELVPLYSLDIYATDGSGARLEPLTLNAYDSCRVQFNNPTASLKSYTTDDANITVSVQVYRTKQNGADYYLLYEEDLGALSALGATLSIDYFDYIKDADLGAVYTDDVGDRGAAPSGKFGVFAQGRMFVAGVSAQPQRLYYSKIYGYDYFNPLHAVDIPDEITGLARMGESVIVFSEGGIWKYSPVDEFGQLDETASPVGTTNPASIIETDFGLLFARHDGIYIFDGVTSRRVSDKITNWWLSQTNSWSGAYIPGLVVYCNGSKIMTADTRAGEWKFSEVTSPGLGYSYLSSSPSDNYIYVLARDGSSGYVYRLFAGSGSRTMTMKTKQWGGGQKRAWAVIIDMDPNGSSATVTVGCSSGDTQALTFSDNGRRTYRKLLDHSMYGEYFDVQVSGTATVYSIRLELE